MSARILVIDDEVELRLSVSRVLSRLGHEVVLASTAVQGLDRMAAQPFELVLTDYRLPDLDGLEVLARARALQPDAEVVVLTAFASFPLAVQAVKPGAYDFLQKPFKRADLERVVGRALEKQALAAENRRLRQQVDDRGRSPLDRIIGQSPAIRALLRVVEQVAPSAATVLIEGPSGTGKELVAEALHGLSARREGPLVKVNCSAIPETLLEAELFGYQRGAFTGALTRKDGRFALARGGTLLLDEIGTLSLTLQAKLLRVLQDGIFEPLGSTRSLQSDCRVLAATNADLRREVREGRFREDLYYRLNVIDLIVPTLRERADDIPLLASHFLAVHAARNHKVIDGFSPDVLAALQAYEWPGNVRELQHAVERAVVLTAGRTIDLEHLPEAVSAALARTPEPLGLTVSVPLGTPLEDVERIVIEETLRRTGGNKVRAASMLGISPRTIYRKKAQDAAETE